jgi:hypothetical protein
VSGKATSACSQRCPRPASGTRPAAINAASPPSEWPISTTPSSGLESARETQPPRRDGPPTRPGGRPAGLARIQRLAAAPPPPGRPSPRLHHCRDAPPPPPASHAGPGRRPASSTDWSYRQALASTTAGGAGRHRRPGPTTAPGARTRPDGPPVGAPVAVEPGPGCSAGSTSRGAGVAQRQRLTAAVLRQRYGLVEELVAQWRRPYLEQAVHPQHQLFRRGKGSQQIKAGHLPSGDPAAVPGWPAAGARGFHPQPPATTHPNSRSKGWPGQLCNSSRPKLRSSSRGACNNRLNPRRAWGSRRLSHTT